MSKGKMYYRYELYIDIENANINPIKLAPNNKNDTNIAEIHNHHEVNKYYSRTKHRLQFSWYLNILIAFLPINMSLLYRGVS